MSRVMKGPGGRGTVGDDMLCKCLFLHRNERHEWVCEPDHELDTICIHPAKNSVEEKTEIGSGGCND